jgi:hypothetical protein
MVRISYKVLLSAIIQPTLGNIRKMKDFSSKRGEMKAAATLRNSADRSGAAGEKPSTGAVLG